MVGCGWWTDGWWREAASSGLMDIGNHSMDHFHVTLPCNPEGVASFKPIDSQDACDYQVRDAQTRLRDITDGLASGLFAYPYGDFSDYIVDEYLPRFGDTIGVSAAFATQPEPVHSDTPRWQMPRYVCGHDWKSPQDLEQILVQGLSPSQPSPDIRPCSRRVLFALRPA